MTLGMVHSVRILSRQPIATLPGPPLRALPRPSRLQRPSRKQQSRRRLLARPPILLALVCISPFSLAHIQRVTLPRAPLHLIPPALSHLPKPNTEAKKREK